ncbi:hypothetical protein ACLMJK_008192 [Lecanora helva]
MVYQACSQCINTKRECPGYVARFDLILRDQTTSTRKKAQRKKKGNNDPKKPSATSAVSEEAPPTNRWTPINPGEGSSNAMTIASPSLDANVPRMFNDFPEQQAICAFFLDFVLLPRHPDSVQGHLEHLLPLYNQTSPDSPLSLATSSVALAFSANSPSRKKDQSIGQSVFGRALKRTSTAIRNPVESRKDETLMAVLLLGLYEKINASADVSKSEMAKTHNAGAAALIMHRGQANVASSVAVGLLFAVRSQLVEYAIEDGTTFKRCPDALSSVFKSAPQNAAARLTSATVNIADLRASAKSALLLPKAPDSEREINDLLEYAISVDLLVAAWPYSLPEDWKSIPADGFDFPLGFPKAAFVYNDKKEMYLDLWVQSIWNQYRSARIKIQTLILDCIAWLDNDFEHQWYWRAIYAKMITQEMADDICASVPFALGTKTQGLPGERDGIEYPYIGTQRVSEEHRRAASALGGWHLLEPMRTCLRASAGSLRDGQTEWIVLQMQRISRIYALQSQPSTGTPSPVPPATDATTTTKSDKASPAVGAASSSAEVMSVEKSLVDRYDFGCPS